VRDALPYSYGQLEIKLPRLTSVLSMNAAVSASVVLASRLCTDVAVFALALFSVEAFALFPMLRQRLQVLIDLCFFDSGADLKM